MCRIYDCSFRKDWKQRSCNQLKVESFCLVWDNDNLDGAAMNVNECYKFVDMAREFALHSPFSSLRKDQHHVSLLLTKSGKFLTIGMNMHKTHPLNSRYGWRGTSIHSELSAYLTVRWLSVNFHLINFRFNPKGELRNSRPCNCCVGFLESTERLLNVYYSTNEGKFEELKNERNN